MPSATGILKIDLNAIASNWQHMRDFADGAEVGAVIKANAYGLGSKKIAELLFDQGCYSFFVTTLDEALEIIPLVSSKALIYVLGGVQQGDEFIFAENNFIPVIYSAEMFTRWVNFCVSTGQCLATAIKIDTGMSRFGIQINEFLKLFPALSVSKINIVMLMSHLACADDRSHFLNQLQLKRFQEIVLQAKSIFPSLKASLANSSGIFLGKEWHFDLVRPGAALYGINPQPGEINPLQQAVRLRLPVLQVKTMERDVVVGYSSTATVLAGSRLAIAAGGYADGVHRLLGLKPTGMCCGEMVSALGRISMDATIFDVSKLQAADSEIMASGIEVVNDVVTLDYLSQQNNCLGYEVLTSMGSRFQRIYEKSR